MCTQARKLHSPSTCMQHTFIWGIPSKESTLSVLRARFNFINDIDSKVLVLVLVCVCKCDVHHMSRIGHDSTGFLC
jgi:hypothetical protein